MAMPTKEELTTQFGKSYQEYGIKIEPEDRFVVDHRNGHVVGPFRNVKEANFVRDGLNKKTAENVFWTYLPDGRMEGAED